jgi:hypothetical protein
VNNEEMKIGVFLHGTAIMHAAAAGVDRDERVQQVRRRDPSVADFASYIPPPAPQRSWQSGNNTGQPSSTSARNRRRDDIRADTSVIRRYGFPPGPVHERHEGEDYGPFVARRGRGDHTAAQPRVARGHSP